MESGTDWEIPEPLSIIEVCTGDSEPIVVRRHGNPNARVRLVLSHGNGLAIDLYVPFWSLLAKDFDLVIYDLRNHGWNRVGRKREHNIPTLIHDHDLILDAAERHFGDKPTVGVFHSLSTLVSLLSDAGKYSALVLFDPPICKPTMSVADFDVSAERLAAMARRRSHRFEELDDFAELLSYIPHFQNVSPEVRGLMARTTLRESADGQGYELRCPREYEAQITEYLRSFAPLLDLTNQSCPTKVVGADPTVPNSFLPTFDLSHILTVDYDFLPDSSHLLQLEQPAECVAILREFLDKSGLLQ